MAPYVRHRDQRKDRAVDVRAHVFSLRFCRFGCIMPFGILPTNRGTHMKHSLIVSLAILLSATAFNAGAAPAEPSAKTAQQNKMTTCNADASGKKGDERKAFMKTCLSAKPEAVSLEKPMSAQQEKMKTCNVDASGKKGDERKSFMKSCLSDKPMAPVAMTQQQKMKSCNSDASGKKGDDRKAFMKTCLSAN